MIDQFNEINKMFPEVKEREITKAIYLMGSKSAFYNGHAGLILIDKDQKGVFYSTMFSIEETPGIVVGETAPFKLYRKELSAEQVKKYFLTGKIPDINDDLVTAFYLSNYDKYIIIPIESRGQGRAIFQRAEHIHKKPGDYNLYTYNCGHIAQDILKAGDTNFAPVSGDMEIVKNIFAEIKGNVRQWNLFLAVKNSVNGYKTAYELGIIPKGAFQRGIKWAIERQYAHGVIRPDSKMEIERKKHFMKIVAKESLEGVKKEHGLPFGTIVVLNGKVIGAAHDMRNVNKDKTTTSITLALKKAIQFLKKENRLKDLNKAEIFTSAEPDIISSSALVFAGISKVVAGATREDVKKLGLNNTKMYDIFNTRLREQGLNVRTGDNIGQLLKFQFKYNNKIDSKEDSAWIFKVRRNKQGKIIESRLISKGQDSFNKTGDLTEYGAVNAIRNAIKIVNKSDLSEFELVSASKLGPISLGAAAISNIKNIYTGNQMESFNKNKFFDAIRTIQGEYGKSKFNVKYIGRNECLKSFVTWKTKQKKILYSKI
jgi:guanine deaminase